MGGSIEDAFGGIGPILLPMAIAGFGIIFSSWNLLVKITDQDAKNNKFKSIKYWKLVSIVLTAIACFFLVRYMLPATMKMELEKECKTFRR
jgi:K(+)-stimulated pyrophosphate-energized sodium pump